MKENEIELLNSEGMILLLVKINNDEFVIYDFDECIVDICNKNDVIDFVHGDKALQDCNGRWWKYQEQPGDMKPDLKELDEFIGIDTTNKIY